jgi:hypothetical protein
MKPRVEERDVVAEAHIIARSAPGLGHPFDLPCWEFDAHLRHALEGHGNPAQDDGRSWMRRYVEQR